MAQRSLQNYTCEASGSDKLNCHVYVDLISMEDIYNKQLQWKGVAMEKARQAKEDADRDKDKDLTFAPKFATAAKAKKFTGSASELSRTAGDNHVQRHAKARREKKGQSYIGTELNRQKAVSKGTTQRSTKVQDSVLLPSEKSKPPGSIGEGIESIPYGPNSEIDIARFVSKYDESNDFGGEEDDFGGLAVEVLERERREWRLERLRLMHCIHHQQIELAQRAAAAHERATEIAKEFSRAIETYEERLLLVENNVQQEIKGMKGITDSLKSAVEGMETGQAFTNNIESRLFGLEKTTQDILEKLDAISIKMK